MPLRGSGLHTRWALSLRYVDTETDRARWRTTASCRIHPTLQVGLEFNPVVGEWGPVATWFPIRESARWPAVFLGTSSDRIGSPEGKRAYYLTLAKNLEWVPLSLYGTLNYSEWEEGWNFPFGANLEPIPRITIQPMYDGRRPHLLGTYSLERANATILWAWLERVGMAFSAGF